MPILAARPGILMLDEPFSALDAHLKSVLEQNLVSLFDAFRGTILYVSHDIDEALRFCDRIAVVEAATSWRWARARTWCAARKVRRASSFRAAKRHAGRARGRAPRMAAEVGR
ncbi:MAG: hypothetical protein V8T51_06025 [Senegalimassilia faecalis]